MLDQVSVQCPCCWEQILLEIEPGAQAQEYVEDCHVCCRPMVVIVQGVDGDGARVLVRGEDE